MLKYKFINILIIEERNINKRGLSQMLNPNMFIKPSFQGPNRKIEIEKISGIERTRWDEPIEVPLILYQKLNISPPVQSNNLSQNQVSKHYPPSLIEFIRKAYSRCKDQQQKNAIEAELKDIIEKNKNNLNDTNWDNYPLPNIIQTVDNSQRPRVIPQQYATSFSSPSSLIGPSIIPPKTIQKQTIMIPSMMHNQSLLDKIQKPSNLNQVKINQPSQRFQSSLLQKQQNKPQILLNNNQLSQTTMFRFKNQEDVRLQMHNKRYEKLSEKYKSQTQTQPINQIKTTFQPSKPSLVAPIQPLQVVESRLPQKVYEVKPLPQNLKKPVQTKKQTPKITNQQLASIVRVGKQEDLRTVAKRFTQFNKIKPVKHVQVQQQVQEQQMDYKIVGRCTKIDKPYLRITHRPDPQTVRPETILRKAFNYYKAQYKKNVAYDLIISQFRSIRQDLTVQNIRNSFTVQVYEQNFRMSLFEDDTIQMKQCQTNLWQLYRQGLYNKKADRTKFISYHFICMILQQRYKQLEYMLTQIPPEVLEDPHIQQTLKLKKFLVIGNYHAVFTFYSHQDQTCQKLINHYIDKVRVKFLVMACKTFGSKIPFKFLGINSAEDEDVLQALAKEEGAVVNDGELLLKQSYDKLKDSQYLQVKKVTSLLD